MILEYLWLASLIVNVVPLAIYILYMMNIAKRKSWDINMDRSYTPYISLVVPTYEEENMIGVKLQNISEVNYPREKLEVVIVDSASKDDTVLIAREWSRLHPEVKIRIVRQPERRGMVSALVEALDNMQGQIFVKTDADCLLAHESLSNAVCYLADSRIGAVAGTHKIVDTRASSSIRSEMTYREFYRWLRIGESKLHSTVPYEGELMFVKKEVLDRISFDQEIGADDVPTALRVVKSGYRAIVVEDVNFIEQTPYTWREKYRQKIRRGRHVFQSLWKYKHLIVEGTTVFHRLILPFEIFIHIVNPFIMILMLILSGMVLISHPMLLLLTGVLVFKRVREMLVTYLASNSIMFLAVLMEIKGKESVTWPKIKEIREGPPVTAPAR